MEIIERMLITLENKGLKMSALCSHLKINTSTMANWKTRKTDPPSKYIIPICEFLDVSPSWLLTGDEQTSSSSSEVVNLQQLKASKSYELLGELSDEEIELIQNYRFSLDKDQGLLLGMSRGYASKTSSSSIPDSSASNLSTSKNGENEKTKPKVV